MLLVALPRTLHLLLTAAIDHSLLLTPAPILLLAAIGLATGSRFWRLATLVLLAGQLPLNLYYLHRLGSASPFTSTQTALFDRTWSIPGLASLAPLAAVTLLIALGIVRLARRRAV